ncbi:MAG: desulfoferrodoxin [Bacteroidaceae bacterium]|nr:desulfoferrodoxin [Prevotellaceae bacterium]MDY5631957.1 desulfoferrodoxin [Bacteroidaceae bacterium]
MAKKLEIYKCEKCGNIFEVVEAGGGVPSCCGELCKPMKENTTDAATEKHVPVIEKIDGGYRVSVGSVEHPMTPEHYIQWIELVTENEVLRHYLTPDDKPVAEFKTTAEKVTVREYCNLHGLWKAEK